MSAAAPPALPGPGLHPVEDMSASRSADDKATEPKPTATFPMNARRVMTERRPMRSPGDVSGGRLMRRWGFVMKTSYE
jgi:hypothetical protein